MSHSPEKKEIILQIYRDQIREYESAIRKLKKIKRMLAASRLLTVLAAIAVGRLLWPGYLTIFLALFILFVLFIYLVFEDSDRSAAIIHFDLLILVNRREIDTMTYALKGYDNGQSFVDMKHPYSADLDLFGEFSLYQWMSRCHSDQAKKRLAERLKNSSGLAEIKSVQQAVKELATKMAWCQQIQASSMANPLTFDTEKKISLWLNSRTGFTRPGWHFFQYVYPLMPVSLMILYLSDHLTSNGLISGLLVLGTFVFFITRSVHPEFEMISRIQPEIAGIRVLLSLFESEKMSSGLLKSMQEKLKPSGYGSASRAILDFNNILKRTEWRSNLVVGPVLGLFLIWDLRQVLSLNKWKKKNKDKIPIWFDVAAEMEWLISLSSIAHNEPDWCFPEVNSGNFQFRAVEMGHPMIRPEKRILNDFTLEGPGSVALVTGSNMAGKSTFLRSVGINTVLAMMGAPVCATYMQLSESNMVSSMRVADNLAENTSTFYAELKKLKYIIDMVSQQTEVFILLDEVLRGTNSDDRHKGTRALLRQLLKSRAVTIMATHDTELAHSESADPKVSNYHFEGKIKNDELEFDYKIRNGISVSLNATALMKKIGIHFQD